MVQFEVLFDDLGEMGRVQAIIFLLLSYENIAVGINSLATVFIAYIPGAEVIAFPRCKVPPLDNSTAYPNLTESDILNFTTPYDAETMEYDGCKRYGYDLTKCNGDLSCVNTSAHRISCDQGYYYDRSLFSETVITEFDLVCDQKYLNTLSTSLYYLGFMIGSIVFGNFADLVGRKICCIVTYTCGLGCMVGLSFSHTVALYMIFRVATATFLYGTTLGVFVYLMEVVGKKWRTFVGIGYQVIFTIGFMILGGIAYNWRNWHEIMVVSTIISVPFLIFCFIVPESPRWLFTKNKVKEGIKVTETFARINKVTIRDETWEKAKQADAKTEENPNKSKRHTSLDLFRTRDTRIITAKVTFNWFVNSFVYYGISLNAGSLAGDLFVNNTLNGVFEILSYTFCILVMDRIGRRILLTFLLLLAGIGLLLSVVVNEYAGDNSSLITLGVVFAFAGKFGIAGSFSVIYNLTGELYPTVIRTNGVGMGSFFARIGGIVAPFVIELQTYINWLPNTIFGVLSIVGGVLSLTFPETNGHVMMETIEEAERFYRGEKEEEQFEFTETYRELPEAYDNISYKPDFSSV